MANLAGTLHSNGASRCRETMGKSPYKLSFNIFYLVLILLLVGCGRSQEASAPEELNEATSETTTETVTKATDAAPDAPVETQVSESQPSAESSVSESQAAVTEQVSRPAPVALDKKDCGQLATQVDMNQCAAENYSISDKALNQVYQDVRQNLSDAAKAKLTIAEERWIVFRDAQCTFESGRFEGGSIAPLIQSSCMEQITDNRIAELQQSDQTQLSYAEADAQLNDVYQQVQALVDDAQGESLIDVQLSWLDYRDTHCEYEANLSTESDKNICLAEVTETRVWQLQALKDELDL